MAFSALPSNIFPTVNSATLPASFYGSPASKLPLCGQQMEGIATSSSGFVANMPLTFQAPAVSTITTPSIQNATVPTAAQILGDVPTSFQTACAPDSTSGIFSAAAASIQDRPKAKPISKKDGKSSNVNNLSCSTGCISLGKPGKFRGLKRSWKTWKMFKIS
jgi:hypothetical protein